MVRDSAPTLGDPQLDAPGLRCPSHGIELEPSGAALKCRRDHEYPVVDGIPRFVESSYADAFGVQWNRYQRTQLDSHTGLPLSRDRARRCLGEALWNDLDGRSVLECGCGAGRFTEILLDRDALVSSVDLSDAVDANQRNFPQGPTHRVVQADITSLPFGSQQFDVVFCLGVLQHTPNPERTIEALYGQVKPGGWLVIDHYARDLSALTRLGQIARQYFKRVSPERGLRQTERLVHALLPMHRKGRRYGRLISRVSPVLSYYHIYPELTEKLQHEWAMLDTHDTLTDYFKHHRSQRSISRFLNQLGLEDIWCVRGGNGVEARGRRPLGQVAPDGA